MSLKAVVFDLDGTLLDTAPDFIYVLNLLREQRQLPPLPDEDIRKTVSDGARALVTLGFGIQEGDEGFDALKQEFLTLYLKHLATKCELFPGILELLEYLRDRNLSWGIATNKPEIFTLRLLESLELRPACIICPDHVGSPKPDPESLYLAGRLLNCHSDEIIFIGDHQRDIDCGLSAGSITIAAAYGYIKETDNPSNWGAHHIAYQVADIRSVIEQYI